jgi:hypothetical protein
MQNCLQTEGQSVYQHGLTVKNYAISLIDMINSGKYNNNWKLPDWLYLYSDDILKSLMPIEIIEEYAEYHDCGKPYCLIIDEYGKRHFPNHAEVSQKIWLEVGGSPTAAKLMGMDMLIHTIKASDVNEFCKNAEAITLLLVGLVEIHANAQMFGGIESVSFKIKWKQIDKRGKAICEKLFKKNNLNGE